MQTSSYELITVSGTTLSKRKNKSLKKSQKNMPILTENFKFVLMHGYSLTLLSWKTRIVVSVIYIKWKCMSEMTISINVYYIARAVTFHEPNQQ